MPWEVLSALFLNLKLWYVSERGNERESQVTFILNTAGSFLVVMRCNRSEEFSS